MIDHTKTTPEKLAEMNDSLIVDNNYLRGQLLEIRAENEALHTKLAQFTKWNSQLTAKCNWYNCDGARLERENESLKEQVEQGKLDAVPEGWVAIPIIPTDKQIRAMEDQWMRGSNMDRAMREYRSAIAAAPKQEK